MKSENILKLAATRLDDKKAQDIKALKVEQLTSLAEYFLIATATSSTHVKSLCGEVEECLKENGVEPHHTEGKTTGWIVIDYGSVIVHIFTQKEREFYNLDRMWSDAEPIELDQLNVCED